MINADIFAGTDKEQGQQHNKEGDCPLDPVIGDDKMTTSRQPVVITMFLQDGLGAIQAFSCLIHVSWWEGALGVSHRLPAVFPMDGKGGDQHRHHQRDPNPPHGEANH